MPLTLLKMSLLLRISNSTEELLLRTPTLDTSNQPKCTEFSCCNYTYIWSHTPFPLEKVTSFLEISPVTWHVLKPHPSPQYSKSLSIANPL